MLPLNICSCFTYFQLRMTHESWLMFLGLHHTSDILHNRPLSHQPYLSELPRGVNQLFIDIFNFSLFHTTPERMVKIQTILHGLHFDIQFIFMVFVLLEHLSGFCVHTNSSRSLKATDSHTALTLCFRRDLHHTLQYKWKRNYNFISFRD